MSSAVFSSSAAMPDTMPPGAILRSSGKSAQGVQPRSKSSDYHFISTFADLIASGTPVYFQVALKSREYDDYLFDSHMELYDVGPLQLFTWDGMLALARQMTDPALFLIKSQMGIDRSTKSTKRLNFLFFILYVPAAMSNKCSFLKSTNRNYYHNNLWDNNMPSNCVARRYKQMQLKLMPLLEEYDVEVLQFTDIHMFEKYHKLLQHFNKKWARQFEKHILSSYMASQPRPQPPQSDRDDSAANESLPRDSPSDDAIATAHDTSLGRQSASKEHDSENAEEEAALLEGGEHKQSSSANLILDHTGEHQSTLDSSA